MQENKLGPQLVLVDDDPVMHDLIKAFFRPKGYQVLCFENAESALEACEQDGEKWDVLLTDFFLPKMSGVLFTERLKEIHPDLPIILITVSDSAETAIEAIDKGAYDFIVKPVHFPQLLISVKRALHLKNLTGDIHHLRERIKSAPSIKGIVGRSEKFLASVDLAKRVASSNANILITGESGTGKEVFAKFIHAESKKAKGPFVAINCSAIPESLLESELFGHAKGAFTGAQDKKLGLFEEAEDGTLFLDEIGDLSLPLQAKLLRVVQEKKIKRVGENQYRDINVRIISATHKSLVEEIRAHRFREDLFFRLSVIPIMIPSLRDRPEDIMPLAETFLKRFAIENGSKVRSFSKEASKYLLQNTWQGNVRELENSIERAVILANGLEIGYDDLCPLQAAEPLSLSPLFTDSKIANAPLNPDESFSISIKDELPAVDLVVQKYVEFAVMHNGGAKDKTAREIGIDRKTLYRRLHPENNKQALDA